MNSMIVVVGLALLIVFWSVGAYSRLAGMRSRMKNAVAQFGAQLKPRYELASHLVEIAKSYVKQEGETIEAVVAARNQAMALSAGAASMPTDISAMQQWAAAESALTTFLDKLFALLEDCPELNLDQTMIQLNEERVGAENKIDFARQVYNDSVTQYNAAIEQFPSSLVAGMTGFKKAAQL
ncbi:MAG: LemA family protein [Burkholderiales bacterium]|nr:LemA family protein [Burkholderiales bacterium]